MAQNPSPDVVKKAHDLVAIMEVLAGIDWWPAMRQALNYDPSQIQFLGEDGFLVRDVAVRLFHLLEDDYELVGATRRFIIDEFPGWVRDWYIAASKWEFGDDWQPDPEGFLYHTR